MPSEADAHYAYRNTNIAVFPASTREKTLAEKSVEEQATAAKPKVDRSEVDRTAADIEK